jgi:hypothetical protein
MYVTTIRVSVRRSRESVEREWLTVELSAEATVGHGEDWEQAQRSLYEALNNQIAGLIEDRTSQVTSVPVDGDTVLPPAEQGPTSDMAEERCPEHGKAAQGKKGLYCPTRLPDGSWCSWTAPLKVRGRRAR